MDAHTGFLTIAETAELLRLSPTTLRAWRQCGIGPPFVQLGRVIRYSREAIDQWARAAAGSVEDAATRQQAYNEAAQRERQRAEFGPLPRELKHRPPDQDTVPAAFRRLIARTTGPQRVRSN